MKSFKILARKKTTVLLRKSNFAEQNYSISSESNSLSPVRTHEIASGEIHGAVEPQSPGEGCTQQLLGLHKEVNRSPQDPRICAIIKEEKRQLNFVQTLFDSKIAQISKSSSSSVDSHSTQSSDHYILSEQNQFNSFTAHDLKNQNEKLTGVTKIIGGLKLSGVEAIRLSKNKSLNPTRLSSTKLESNPMERFLNRRSMIIGRNKYTTPEKKPSADIEQIIEKEGEKVEELLSDDTYSSSDEQFNNPCSKQILRKILK